VAVVVAAMLASSLGVGTYASASTPPRSTVAGIHGDVNMTIWSIDSDGDNFQAILSGAIGDYGPAVTVLPDGKADPEHTSDLELELRHGTFRLDIGGIAGALRAQTGHEPTYHETCSDYFHGITATVPIVTGSGTGTYHGLRGSFSMSLTVNEDQKSPPCASSLARQILVVSGSGAVGS
jgi:hypothetical protein